MKSRLPASVFFKTPQKYKVLQQNVTKPSLKKSEALHWIMYQIEILWS